MARVRVSTTVDERTLRTVRARVRSRDSQLFDRALRALLDELDTAAELAAIDAAPYSDDPELQMPDPPVDDDLAYDGEVPADVIELAQRRRARR